MTPGIDELASFDRFLRHMTSREYDVIAFDTAPTGHTLRLLSLPDILDSWVGKLIRLRMRLSSITGAFKRLLSAGEEDEEDSALEHLEALKKRIEQAKAILTDPDRTEYNIVMIPEAMSIYETQRSVCFLKDICIPVHSLIVNQIIPENSHCEFCKEKRKLQLGRLAEIRKEFPKKEIHELHLFKDEVRGKKMLEKVARELYG
jgi:arsenite-transporting ATPase